MGRRRALAAIACILSFSCSSAPPKTDNVTTVKNQAAEATTFGNAYYRQGRYDLALQFFTQALDYNTSVDNGDGIIQSYNSIGQVYMALDQMGMAEDIFIRARDRAKVGSQVLFFVSSNNLGELYLRKGEAQRARETFEAMLAIPSSAVSAAQTGLLNHNLGTAHKNLGDYQKALEFFDKSLAVNLKEKLFEEAAADYYMIASVHSKTGDLAEAAKNAELALKYDKQIENSLGIVKDLYALGLISAKRADNEGAYDYFQRSYLVSNTLGAKDDMRRALEQLVPVAEALGKTTEAGSFRTLLAALSSP